MPPESHGSLPSHGGGGGGSGRAVPRCRHIGCVVSHGAAAMSCCVRVIGTCVTCAGCAGCATMTRRGGGIGKCAAARAVTWVSSMARRRLTKALPWAKGVHIPDPPVIHEQIDMEDEARAIHEHLLWLAETTCKD